MLAWFCAIAGSFISLPQLIHLLRGRTSAGLSLLSWQLMLSANIGWIVHGVHAGRLTIIAPNSALLICTVLVLRLIKWDRRLSWLQVSWIGLAMGAICVATDLWIGAVAFGLVVMIPQGFGALAQFRDLLMSADLAGVSPVFLGFGFFMQLAWLSWALLAGDSSVVVAATLTGVLSLLNVAAYALRRTGVLGTLGTRRATERGNRSGLVELVPIRSSAIEPADRA